MSSPPPLSPAVARQPLHTRSITARGFRREDGLFEVEGLLEDTKSFDLRLMSGARSAGAPVHRMWLRITYDATFTIVAAEAASEANPYPGYCESIAPKYSALVGLSMRPGFTAKVRALFGGTSGCTHLTDLIGILATTAFQNVAGQVSQAPDQKPYQLDRCHALATDGAAVARFYPRWYSGSSHVRGDDVPSGNP
jgi:hypothetical protein